MGNVKKLRKQDGTRNLGFGLDINAPLVIPLHNNLDLVKGKDREIYKFDGVDDYVLTDFTGLTDYPFSMSVWASVDNVTGEKSFLTLNDISSSTVYFNIGSNGDKAKLSARNTTAYDVLSTNVLTPNVPFNIIVNFNSATSRDLYLNNNLEVSDTDSVAYNTNIDSSLFGVLRTVSPANYQTGDIYQGRIFNKVLDATDRASIISAGKNGFPVITGELSSYNLTTSSLGSDNVKDLSGNGNHGTSFGKVEFTRTTDGTVIDHNGVLNNVGTDIARFEGARFINDDKGFSTKVGENAIEFDGTNPDEVIIPRFKSTSDDGTKLSGFVVVKSNDLFDGSIYGSYDTENGERSWYLRANTSTNILYFTASDNGTFDAGHRIQYSVENVDFSSQYLYIGFSFNSGDIYFYLNGILQTKTLIYDEASSVFYGSLDFKIGNREDSNPFYGMIDQPIIWDTALTGEQVMQQYLYSKKGSDYVVAPENVVGHWLLNENSQTQPDISGKGNDGTFYSAGVPSVPVLTEGVYDSDVSIPNSTLKGIMSYEGATNLIIQSENLPSYWNNWQTTDSSNVVVAPDGTLSGDGLIANTSDINHVLNYNDQVVSNSTVYTLSQYFKKGNKQFAYIGIRNSTTGDWEFGYFDLVNGVIGSKGSLMSELRIEELDNGWYRCSAIHTSGDGTVSYRMEFGATDTDGDNDYIGDNTTNVLYYWGTMLNTGSFPMPYISTTTAAVSTTADVPKHGLPENFVQGQGSIYCEFECDGIDDGKFNTVLSLTNGTDDDDRILILGKASENYIRLIIDNGNVNQTSIISDNDVLTYNTLHKVMITYEDNNVNFYFDGVKIGGDTSVTIPTNLIKLDIGNRFDDTLQLNGTIKDAKYYNEIKSEADAIKETTL